VTARAADRLRPGIAADPAHWASMTAEHASDPLRLPGAVTLQREPDGLVLRLTGEVDAAVVDKFTADPDHEPCRWPRSTPARSPSSARPAWP
jgi:hypothetical protein